MFPIPARIIRASPKHGDSKRCASNNHFSAVYVLIELFLLGRNIILPRPKAAHHMPSLKGFWLKMKKNQKKEYFWFYSNNSGEMDLIFRDKCFSQRQSFGGSNIEKWTIYSVCIQFDFLANKLWEDILFQA